MESSNTKLSSFLGLLLMVSASGPVGCASSSGDESPGDGDSVTGDGDTIAGDGDTVPGDGDGGDGDTPQGTGGVIDFEVGETLEGAVVVINEFMPSNAVVITDTAGGAGDWIELYNLSSQPVDLGGYYISDKLVDPQRHALPAGLIIQPSSTLLLWADDDEEEGPDHLPFNLSKAGEAVVLSDPAGVVLDSIDYVDATTDSSFARVPDGTGPWAFCTAPTPGAANDPSCAP